MIKYTVKTTSQFKKDYKNIIKQNKDIKLLKEVVDIISSGETLPEKYKDHQLTGNWKTHRECHITPDWLLIYKIHVNILVLTLSRTGSHSSLF